jgi:PTS system nitrogen regulatory IIA component
MTACPDRVARWLQPETAILDVEVMDVDHALRLIADSIADHHHLDADRTYRALARREAAGSTGMGSGFAIPHGRAEGLDGPLTLLLRAKTPVPFRAPDGLPVKLMLAIMVPEDGDKNDHLQLLALVAELFSRAGFRTSLDAAKSSEEVAEAFRCEIAAVRRR